MLLSLTARCGLLLWCPHLAAQEPPYTDRDRRLGFRLDLMYGQATEILQGSLRNETRPQVFRPLCQAYGTYVVPAGSEGNYTKDQPNDTRSYWFNFLPVHHTGVRTRYQLNRPLAVQY